MKADLDGGSASVVNLLVDGFKSLELKLIITEEIISRVVTIKNYGNEWKQR